MSLESKKSSRMPARRRGASRRGAILLILAAPAALGAALFTWEISTARPDARGRLVVEVRGATVPVDYQVFRPQPADRPQPAVILLHGVEGPHRAQGFRHRVADRLRDAGYFVYLLEYFDTVEYSDLWLLDESGELNVAAVRARQATDSACWVQAVRAMLAHLSSDPAIDSQRVALDGYSLGGFLAVAAAQEFNADETTAAPVRAVVVNWGARFDDTTLTADFPAAFFVHGELDQTVTYAWAEQTVAELRTLGRSADLHCVPAAGHLAISAEADRQTMRFLALHLDQSSPLQPGPWPEVTLGDVLR